LPPDPSRVLPVVNSQIRNYRVNNTNVDIYEKFKDSKGIIRSRQSKKERQYNDKKKKDKGTNNEIQNIT